MFPNRHGELVLLMFQFVALVADVQIIHSEIPLKTSQEDVVRGRFRCFCTKFRHSRIFYFYFIKELSQESSLANCPKNYRKPSKLTDRSWSCALLAFDPLFESAVIFERISGMRISKVARAASDFACFLLVP